MFPRRAIVRAAYFRVAFIHNAIHNRLSPMPQRISAVLSDPLYEIAKELRKRNRYRSWPEVLQGFLRYWALTQADHHLSTEWAAMTGPERDALDAGLLEALRNKEVTKGSWLKSEIFAAVDEWIRENESYPRTKPIAEKLAKRVAQLAMEKPIKKNPPKR